MTDAQQQRAVARVGGGDRGAFDRIERNSSTAQDAEQATSLENPTHPPRAAGPSGSARLTCPISTGCTVHKAVANCPKPSVPPSTTLHGGRREAPRTRPALGPKIRLCIRGRRIRCRFRRASNSTPTSSPVEILCCQGRIEIGRVERSFPRDLAGGLVKHLELLRLGRPLAFWLRHIQLQD